MKSEKIPLLYVVVLALCILSIQGCKPSESQTDTPNPNPQPLSSIRKPAGKTFGITPEKFRVALNAQASTKNLPERFKIKSIVVEPGEVKNAATLYITDSLGASVAVDKVSGEIESVIVAGKSETVKQSTDLLLFSIMIATTVDSSVSEKRVYAILPKLFDAALKNVGKQFSEIEGDSKLGATVIKANGLLLLSVAPRER